MKRILCALCISLVGWQAMAGEVDDSLKKLEAAVEKMQREQDKPSADSENPAPPKLNAKTQLFALREQIKTDRFSNAIRTLEGFNNDALSEDVRKSIDELIGTLRKDLDARIIKARAPYDRVRNHANDAVKNAKNADDLDAVLQELDNVKNLPDIQVSDVGLRERGSVEQAYSFVAKWQEYLAAKAGGYDEEARSIAKDLVKLPKLLLPRSELLAKAYEPKNSEAKQDKAMQNIVEEAVNPSPLIIDIGQDGEMRIGKSAPVDTQKMVGLVKEYRASNPNLAVVIRLHKSHQILTDVMQALQTAEVRNFTFTMDSAPEKRVNQPTPAK